MKKTNEIPGTYYVCPSCGKHSSCMALLKEETHPSKEVERVFSFTAHELLKCPCGMKLRWIDMKPMQTYFI